MALRSVERVISPPRPHFVGDGFRVHNFIPSIPPLGMVRMDPFIMLDYNSKFEFPPSKQAKGVGVHPHRGFETVTIAYQGKVAHHDSAGNSGIIGEGEVQWMTAASGVLHKEYHEKNFSETGGIFQMVQLWVNLPAKHKMSSPKYQGITRDQIKELPLDNAQGSIALIAGEYNGVKGPANTFTPVHLSNLKLKTGGKASFSFPQNYHTAMIVIEGNVTINTDKQAPLDHFVLMSNDGEDFTIKANSESVVLVMSGEPIGEPIAAHGPFVMNTQKELLEAFEDFHSGKFGELTE